MNTDCDTPRSGCSPFPFSIHYIPKYYRIVVPVTSYRIAREMGQRRQSGDAQLHTGHRMGDLANGTRKKVPQPEHGAGLDEGGPLPREGRRNRTFGIGKNQRGNSWTAATHSSLLGPRADFARSKTRKGRTRREHVCSTTGNIPAGEGEGENNHREAARKYYVRLPKIYVSFTEPPTRTCAMVRAPKRRL